MVASGISLDEFEDCNKEDDEIELYSLNTDIAECYDGWDKKGFSWAKKNLISLIPKEDNDNQL